MNKNGKKDFAYHLSRFLSVYLPGQRNVSENTTPNYLLGYGDTTNVDDEAEAMNDVVSSIFNRIKDEKVKELIIAQMKVASNMYA